MRVSFMLDRQIDIQRAITSRNANTNEIERVWVNFSSIRASETDAKTGTEKETDNQIIASQRITFTIRWRPNVLKTDRVQYDGKIYDIEAISKIGRRKFLNLVCKERDSTLNDTNTELTTITDGSDDTITDGSGDKIFGFD